MSKLFVLFAALLSFTASDHPPPPVLPPVVVLAQSGEPALPAPLASECCKVCRKGKACGNTCIAREKDCHQPPGCACDAFTGGAH